MSEPQRFFHDDPQAMAQSLAVSISDNLNNAEEPLLILPGGGSPKLLIKALADQDVNWDNVNITTTDERCVPLEDERSNAGQIKQLSPNSLWLCEDGITDKLLFPSAVTVLGMGLDGHFASLFPGGDMGEGKTLVKTQAPAEPKDRISLGIDALLNTNRLILLIPDSEKWNLCQKALDGAAPELPIVRLFRQAGEKLELHIVGHDE